LKQALVILIAWGAATAAPFSHRIHLKLISDCAKCHSTAQSSTKAADNLLPSKTVCAQCHKEGEVAIPAPGTTMVANFSHGFHLKMGNVAPILAAAIDKKDYLSNPGDIRRHLDSKNACEACHRGLEESDAVSKIDMPQMADCLVCHNQIENPFSCEKCHAKTANLKPASHVPGFQDMHNKKSVAKVGCAVCHGREFRCLGCH
jgi:predicted CXXCH cytochrome family protein